jgi:hypothetical protein
LTLITREKAEHLLDNYSILKSEVYQDKKGIHVVFKLSDQTALLYKFDTKKKIKSYFIGKERYASTSV